MKLKLSLLLLALACSGCSTVKLKTQQFDFSRTSVGVKLTLKTISVESGTNGIQKILVENMSSDQVEGLKAVAEGVAKGLVSSMGIPAGAGQPVGFAQPTITIQPVPDTLYRAVPAR